MACSKNIPILHRFRDIIAYFSRFKEVNLRDHGHLGNTGYSSHGQPEYKI